MNCGDASCTSCFLIPGKRPAKGEPSRWTPPFSLSSTTGTGSRVFFVYTDPAFRIEPLQGCVAIEAVLFAFVEEKNGAGWFGHQFQLVQPPANLSADN